MKIVLAYLWSIELTIGDLQLSTQDKSTIDQARNGQANKQVAIDLLKSKYLQGSPATFIAPPEDRGTGYTDVTGDPANGQLVYELSCLHCHEGSRYAFFDLDDSKASFKYLKKHMARYTRYSLYQVARYGTSPLNGKRTYMPNYTSEKLSNQQIEDLRAYIEQRAE